MPAHPTFKAAWVTLAAGSLAALAILGACSDGAVTSKVAGPNVPELRFHGGVGENDHEVTLCVDSLSSPGSYTFATAFNPDSSGFNDLEDDSIDPDLSGFGITQNTRGPYIPGDIITTPVTMSPGDCEDVFVRMTTPDNNGNRLWTGIFGTVNPSAAVDITATIPAGYTYSVQCANDDPDLPHTDGCDAGPIVANPIVSSANVSHGARVTYTFTAPPAGGCTLTVLWWKTEGAAAAAEFDFDGRTNNGLAVLNTQPRGNPYYVLAHQYIAAALNVQNGASMDGAALDAFNAATTYFAAANPGNSLPPGYTKAGVTALAKTLEDYNNGVIGPGHCDD
jgi:hypothetical protein